MVAGRLRQRRRDAGPDARAAAGATVAGPLRWRRPTRLRRPTDSGSTDPTATAATADGHRGARRGPDGGRPRRPRPPATAPAGDCTGTDENRTFYGSVAAAVDWTVYCPVLPSGWFVETGQYRLAGGGRLAIAYRGPGGARFTLDEGAWCPDESGCAPVRHGRSAPTAFGDREGTLVATDDGELRHRRATPASDRSAGSWSATALDEAAVRTFGAALIAVGG